MPFDPQSSRVASEKLRWRCPPEWTPYETTSEIQPIKGIVGQDDAVDALRFGLEIQAHGQNVFVRGLRGTGRLTLVRHVLAELRDDIKPPPDYAYVHNFTQTDRPRLLTFPPGKARAFKHRVEEFVRFLREDLGMALASPVMKQRLEALDTGFQGQVDVLREPFEAELQEQGLALTMMQVGQATQYVLLPIVEGEPVPFEQYAALAGEGKITAEEVASTKKKLDDYARRFGDLSEQMGKIKGRHEEAVRDLYEREMRALLVGVTRPIAVANPGVGVDEFMREVVDDVVEARIVRGEERPPAVLARLFAVNVVSCSERGDPAPVIVENMPTLTNLLGTIDKEFAGDGQFRSDHTMISAGALLRANGGYLILEARDLLTEPGAWKVLVRTLRSRELQVIPPEFVGPWGGVMLNPEPIPLRVKVVLLGSPGIFHALDAGDPDFPELFKVLADFDGSIPRDQQAVRFYGGVVARLSEEEKLLPFSAAAVRALAEHGARIAAEAGRLTTRFGRLVDVVREAEFYVRKDGRKLVGAEDVRDTIARARRRGDLPARRYRQRLVDGTIRIETSGKVVGQVNGLAVIHAGSLVYGFPSRITATIGPGTAGTINVEGEAQLSGSIHTKGFYILGGLLRHLLRTRHPLVFSASIAFEQSYGGIDGDSASGAEMVCLISALTGIPMRQDLAMTGAIDQKGHIQPIGAVTEKIEGFFDTCAAGGLTGTQGVIIPTSNAAELMLRSDIVEACEAGKFSVFAVERIEEALELFLDMPAGTPDENDRYEQGTVLALAQRRAYEYWQMVVSAKRAGVEGEQNDDAQDDASAE